MKNIVYFIGFILTIFLCLNNLFHPNNKLQNETKVAIIQSILNTDIGRLLAVDDLENRAGIRFFDKTENQLLKGTSFFYKNDTITTKSIPLNGLVINDLYPVNYNTSSYRDISIFKFSKVTNKRYEIYLIFSNYICNTSGQKRIYYLDAEIEILNDNTVKIIQKSSGRAD